MFNKEDTKLLEEILRKLLKRRDRKEVKDEKKQG